ncbi:MAG: RHS repeat-associated core domain-containing protein [Verrucomicrobiota bacterium]
MSSSSTSGPPITDPCKECDKESTSQYPVRYGSGEVVLDETDLSGRAFGFSWGHSRSYGNQLSRNNTGFNGNSWLVGQVAYLVFGGPDLVMLIRGVNNSVWFQRVGESWLAQLGTQLTLRAIGSDWEVYDRSSGLTQMFYGEGAAWYLRGQLRKLVNASGSVAAITRDGQGRITRWEATDGGPAASGSLRFDYVYHMTGAGSGRLRQVTQVITSKGVEMNVRRASYGYYGLASPNGNFQDLKAVGIEQWSQGAWVSVRKSGYRYYLPGDPQGFAHGLKYVMGPEGMRRMEAAGVGPDTAPDETLGATLGVAGFSDKYFRYGNDKRVTMERVDGGTREFTFQYRASEVPIQDYNGWSTRTTQTLPDGTEEIVYCNFKHLVIFKITRSEDREWYAYWRYDGNGRTILRASSEAVESYDPFAPHPLQFVKLKDDEGLISTSHYYASTDAVSGAAEGFLHYEAVRRGEDGDVIKQNEYKYVARENGGQTVFRVVESTVYNGNSDTGASHPAVTSYGYSWYPLTLQVKQVTKTLPVVEPEQHGDGESYSTDEFYDEDGYNTWSRNELGMITRRIYDKGLGVVAQLIQDVRTSGATGVPIGWMTMPGGGLNLVTDYEYDSEGRQTQELGPVHDVALASGNTAVRTAVYSVYRDDDDEVWSAKGYATGSAPGYNYVTVSPVTITRTNANHQTTDSIQTARDGCGRLSSSESFPQSKWLRWTSMGYDVYNRLAWQRMYFDIPGFQGDVGINGTNYNQTDYGYDIMTRKNRERSGGGTITRTVYDARDLVVSTWMGINDNGATDSDPSNGGADGNNMVRLVSNLYDYEGTAGYQEHGNGLLTHQTHHVDATEERITSHTYDWRNRRITTTGEEEFFQSTQYDNRNRITAAERRIGNDAGALLTRNETSYDSLGRVCQQKTFGVEDGELLNKFISANVWYDGAGQTIKTQDAGRNAFNKMDYDSLGRLISIFLCHPEDGLDDGNNNEVIDDIVIEQNESEYDSASNVIATLRMLRFDNATGSGPLNGPSGSQPKSRNYYNFVWPDAIGRTVASANYGTNGGVVPSRPMRVPASSAGILVSTLVYNSAGQVVSAFTPMGIETRSEYDNLGRATKVVENYTDGIPDGAANRTTQYAYNADGVLETLTMQNSATGAQVTRWEYGSTLTESGVASSVLLRAKIFPDSDEAANPSSVAVPSDRIEYVYNRLGQVTGSTDQNGTIHGYDYDARGRLVADRVTALGSGVDGKVRRISTTYDNLDHLTSVTSYDAADAGTVMNQVVKTYDPFGQLASDAQAHAGAVDPSPDSSTPTVAYHLDMSGEGDADPFRVTARLTDTIYPDGRTMQLGYGDVGSIDDVLSRVATVMDVTTSSPWEVAAYTYLGADTSVISGYAEPEVELTYIKQGSEPDGPAGDPYAGLDRFGRIIDHRWIKSSADIERIQYGYNLGGLRQWRLDTLAHNADKDQDNYYNYDGLGQVIARDQGQLANDRTGVDGIPSREEDWVYDPSGNWDNYRRKVDGANTVNQNRTHTKVNEIQTFDGSGIPVVFDRAGNMTRMPKALAGTSYHEATWDAWNRLVRVKTPGGSGGYDSYSGTALDVRYAYDGQTRRTTTEVVTGQDPGTTHYYYSANWKCIEQRLGPTTVPYKQFVFGARGRNDLVFRDQFEGALVDRLYALCDNMGSKVAVTGDSGIVIERYAFTAFGDLESTMAPDYTPRSYSVIGWETLFHGEVRDSETGWYNYGYRYYLPQLGRWPSRDPIGEMGGNNLTLFALNNCINHFDLLGLSVADAFTPSVHDGSVASILDHALNSENNQILNPFSPFSGQGSDYYMKISYLNIDETAIVGGADGNLFAELGNEPGFACSRPVGDTVRIPSTLVPGWFCSSLPWTIGHINLKVEGFITTVKNGSVCQWDFKGTATALPDMFDFDQKARPDVTSARDVAIGIIDILQKLTSRKFFIKPYGSQEVKASGRCP